PSRLLYKKEPNLIWQPSNPCLYLCRLVQKIPKSSSQQVLLYEGYVLRKLQQPVGAPEHPLAHQLARQKLR
ncbi:hypothetical protein Tsubulata_006185, partial [Turnera subulata]